MSFAKPRGYKNACATETIPVKEDKDTTWTGYIGSLIKLPIETFRRLTVKDDNC